MIVNIFLDRICFGWADFQLSNFTLHAAVSLGKGNLNDNYISLVTDNGNEGEPIGSIP